MIKDKNLGLVVTENEEETAWYDTAEGIRNEVRMLKNRITKDKENLKKSAREVHEKFIRGCKAAIKANKRALLVQKEILKLAESKLKN